MTLCNLVIGKSERKTQVERNLEGELHTQKRSSDSTSTQNPPAGRLRVQATGEGHWQGKGTCVKGRECLGQWA